MKIRSTVWWPEQNVECNQVVDVDDTLARERIAAGLAVEHVDPPAEQPADPAQ